MTKIGQMAQELAAQNPWWRDPSGWEANDPDLREVRSSGLTYHSAALTDLDPGSLYLLRGPRRAGKTVTVKELVVDLISSGVPATAVVRVAVDGWRASDLRTLTQNAALPRLPEGQRRHWLLDEVTSVTGDWATQIKWLRDNDPGFRDATVVLTGSNASGLTDAAGALAGRRGKGVNLDRTLLPMGFRSFAGQLLGGGAVPGISPLPLGGLHTPAARDAYQDLLPWLNDLVVAWEQYLTYGGYPVAVAAAHAGQPVPQAFLEDLFNIIANDAFQNSRLASATEMALLERLWATISSYASLTGIGDDIDVRHEVVARHVGYLRDAYLLWQCPQKDDRSWKAKERAQDKVYAVDPLIARLAHLRNPNRADIDLTALAEMQLGNAIRRRVISDHPEYLTDHFVFHVRTASRKEIDFVSERLGGVALEGKYTEGAWRSEAATVNASTWDGILTTRNVLETEDKDSAWAVPACLLAYLLDT